MTLTFEMAALERFQQSGEEYFGFPPHKAQDSVLEVASPDRSAGDGSDAGAAGAVFRVVLNVKDDRDLESGAGVDEVDKGKVKRCLQQLQKSGSAK